MTKKNQALDNARELGAAFGICLALFLAIGIPSCVVILQGAARNAVNLGGPSASPSNDGLALFGLLGAFLVFPAGAYRMRNTFQTQIGAIVFATWPLLVVLIVGAVVSS